MSKAGATVRRTQAATCLTLAVLSSMTLGAPGIARRATAEPSRWRSSWDPASRELAAEQYVVGAAAAALTVPTMLVAGTAIGRSSSNLAAAAVPALLLNAVVPPLAVTGAEYAIGRWRRGPGVVRFHPAVWAAVGVNLVGIVIGALAGVSTADAQSFGIYSLLQTLTMPMATQLVMHYKEQRQP